MKRWQNLLVVATILLLIASCSSVSPSQNSLFQNPQNNIQTSPPDVPLNPDNSFFPLRRDSSDGKIYVSYRHEPCVKRFLGICTKRILKLVFFKDLEWFYLKGYGLSKGKDLSK